MGGSVKVGLPGKMGEGGLAEKVRDAAKEV
jgi:hypothetical protein